MWKEFIYDGGKFGVYAKNKLEADRIYRASFYYANKIHARRNSPKLRELERKLSSIENTPSDALDITQYEEKERIWKEITKFFGEGYKGRKKK